MEPTQTTEPAPTQTTEPAADPAPAAPAAPVPAEPAVDPNAVPGTFAEPAPEPQQTTEPPSPTEPAAEPAEPTEPAEPDPDARVVPQPSEYKLPEGAPDQLRIFAHENGLTQQQLDASINTFVQYGVGMRNAEATAMRELGEAHVKNWGPEAKTNLHLAKQAMGWLDQHIEGFSDYLNAGPAANNPHVLQALYLVGRSMQEGGFLKSSVPRKPGEKTAAEAMYGDNHPTQG